MSALELAIANLNKAISTLKAGSTEPTKGFKDAGLVETKAIMETRMLSVTAEVRNALSLYSQNSQLTMQDQEAMNSFLSSPVALVQSPHKQLDADEAFFETTKESCKAKADEWAERSRLR